MTAPLGAGLGRRSSRMYVERSRNDRPVVVTPTRSISTAPSLAARPWRAVHRLQHRGARDVLVRYRVDHFDPDPDPDPTLTPVTPVAVNTPPVVVNPPPPAQPEPGPKPQPKPKPAPPAEPPPAGSGAVDREKDGIAYR
jgi:hypothetical protein